MLFSGRRGNACHVWGILLQDHTRRCFPCRHRRCRRRDGPVPLCGGRLPPASTRHRSHSKNINLTSWESCTLQVTVAGAGSGEAGRRVRDCRKVWEHHGNPPQQLFLGTGKQQNVQAFQTRRNVRKLSFQYKSQAIDFLLKLRRHRTCEPYDRRERKIQVTAGKPGIRTIVVTFNSNEMQDVVGEYTLLVDPQEPPEEKEEEGTPEGEEE